MTDVQKGSWRSEYGVDLATAQMDTSVHKASSMLIILKQCQLEGWKKQICAQMTPHPFRPICESRDFKVHPLSMESLTLLRKPEECRGHHAFLSC